MTRQERRGELAFIAIVLGALVIGLVMTLDAHARSDPRRSAQSINVGYVKGL